VAASEVELDLRQGARKGGLWGGKKELMAKGGVHFSGRDNGRATSSSRSDLSSGYSCLSAGRKT